MARPRVFVSSTFYDLKHIRSSLDLFIESLGYDSILSEKGDIAYTHDRALDESCYREVQTADIFVLIVGGRYGSAASREKKRKEREFFDRYESVSKLECEAAFKRGIPVFVLVEAAVYTEFQTYLKNRNSKKVIYAHVDNVGVFSFLETILQQPQNNPLKTFERFSDIESWLKEQWAGIFREQLRRESGQKQLAELADQVTALQDVTQTLKRYLEEIVAEMLPKESPLIFEEEKQRLSAESSKWVMQTRSTLGVPRDACVRLARSAKSLKEYARQCARYSPANDAYVRILSWFFGVAGALDEFNQVRKIFELPPLEPTEDDQKAMEDVRENTEAFNSAYGEAMRRLREQRRRSRGKPKSNE